MNIYTYNIYIYKCSNNNTFARDIYNCTITFKKAVKDQSSFLVEIMNFKGKIKPQNPEKKQNKKYIKVYIGFLRVLDAFESGIFPIIETEGTGVSDFDHFKLKILTSKQMLQRLPIVLPYVKAGNISEDLINKILQVIHLLY